MMYLKNFLLLLAGVAGSIVTSSGQTFINRKEVVMRHTVKGNAMDTLASLTVGNGRFAYTVDATGMQTFPEFYKNGVPLGTQSEWCWDHFRDTADYHFEEILKDYVQYSRKVSYPARTSGSKRITDAANWFRQNKHRVQMGNVGLLLIKKNDEEATIKDIHDIKQTLNLWTGEIVSSFTLEGEPVMVKTVCKADGDIVSVRVMSALIADGRLQFTIKYPYPTGQFADFGTNWANVDDHYTSIIKANGHSAVIRHQLATAVYFTKLAFDGTAVVIPSAAHKFIVKPGEKSNSFDLSFGFFPKNEELKMPAFPETRQSSAVGWEQFWRSGGAIDFAGSTDARAFELERRVILSQYLTRSQCAGSYPPQETGLTYNSWYGKAHLEMHWWHGVHYALWGRPQILENSLGWYKSVAAKAKKTAIRQGFKGVRWQKMTDLEGDESPSTVGPFLIWQQPHFITFAELCYRAHPNKQTLNLYKELVNETASFMASYAWLNPATNKYQLGKVLIPAQERFKPENTFNPTYELAYWDWALRTAQKWLERQGLSRNLTWDHILNNLSPLPVKDSVYLACESAPDSYSNPAYMSDHPSVLGAYGMLPNGKMLDTIVMKNTFNLICAKWNWKDTWGWDFPMAAMTAARLGLPEKAIDNLLMDVKTNTYLRNGHNYQNNQLTLYLPGNGGLLTAVAMMCAGWDGNTIPNPGFPKNGKWKVRWEGLKKMF